METALQLLMRDGAVEVHFRPRLSPEQYAEFIELLEASDTLDGLKIAGEAAARRWKVEFRCEKVGV